ncbi:MAG: carbohydrate-binding protein, partial [Betaproteobacteria bacterium]
HDNVKGNAGGQYRTSEDVDIIVSSDSLGGGYVVNNFETGEWLAYTVNVATSAQYDIELRASNGNWSPPPRFHIEIDGVNVTGSVTVPNTGSWNTFQWVGKLGVPLTAGRHVLKIVADQQYFNLDAIQILRN